jgi:hypothetical protein
MRLRRLGFLVGKISLAIAVLAYFPSVAPFTPAILLSFLAFFGAVIAALSGAYRTAALTAYVVAATFLVSPISRGIERYVNLGYLIVGLAVLGAIIAIALYRQYGASAKTNTTVDGDAQKAARPSPLTSASDEIDR